MATFNIILTLDEIEHLTEVVNSHYFRNDQNSKAFFGDAPRDIQIQIQKETAELADMSKAVLNKLESAIT